MDYLLVSSIYLLIETYFLITLRILGFFVTVPIFGGQAIPNTAKISLSLATAFIVMTSTHTKPLPPTQSFLTFFSLGIRELAIGMLMGFSIYFLLAMFYYIGQLVDFQIGFSMVSVFDPISQLQVPISGNLFYLTVAFLLVLSGAHYNFFRALFYSYEVVPIGQGVLLSESLLYTCLDMFGTFFALGFRTALPIVGTILVLDVALGILNRATPQMHIFSIGMSAKILVGLLILYFVLPMFVHISDGVFHEINKVLYRIISGLVPL